MVYETIVLVFGVRCRSALNCGLTFCIAMLLKLGAQVFMLYTGPGFAARRTWSCCEADLRAGIVMVSVLGVAKPMCRRWDAAQRRAVVQGQYR